MSFPFSTIAPGAPARLTGGTFKAVIGIDFPTVKNREALGEMLSTNTGVQEEVKPNGT